MTLASPPLQFPSEPRHDNIDDDDEEQDRLERDLSVEADVSRVREQLGPAAVPDDAQEEPDDDDDEGEEGEESASAVKPQASLYYDASTMASLNPLSMVRPLPFAVLPPKTNQKKAALNRLRAYKPPPFPLWDALPARRRAAVLVLLYADRAGDLRVVVTMRAASLRSFSGHAALPGGKADSIHETPCISPRPPSSFPSPGLANLPVAVLDS